MLLKMAIEIVDFPMKHGDFPQLCKRLPEGSGCEISSKDWTVVQAPAFTHAGYPLKQTATSISRNQT